MKEIQHLEYDLKFTEVLPSAPAGFGWHPKGLAIDRSPCGWSSLGPNLSRDPRAAREGKEGSTSPRLTVWDKCFSCSFNERWVQLPAPGQPQSILTSHQGPRAGVWLRVPLMGVEGPARLQLSPEVLFRAALFQSFIWEHEKCLHFQFTQEKVKNIGQLHFLWGSYEHWSLRAEKYVPLMHNN